MQRNAREYSTKCRTSLVRGILEFILSLRTLADLSFSDSLLKHACKVSKPRCNTSLTSFQAQPSCFTVLCNIYNYCIPVKSQNSFSYVGMIYQSNRTSQQRNYLRQVEDTLFLQQTQISQVTHATLAMYPWLFTLYLKEN